MVRFVCLANSFKEGGRCLAGVVLDDTNNPISTNGHPKWIRPICNTPHGEIHTYLVSHIKVLDIIEIEITNSPSELNYQSENTFFKENSIKVIGKFDKNQLDRLCDNRNLIFCNKGKAIHEDVIRTMSYSLMFIKINQFEIIEKIYDDNPDRPKTRLVFSYNGNIYDLPVTDPVFLHQYHTNPNILNNLEHIYISLSIAVEWKGWYYKLIAGILN